MAFQTVKGFKDVLPPESERTAAFEASARRILGLYGYREIRLPTLEAKELFVKSTGETTDIVEKEMFDLEDAGGRQLALRPEGTPGAVRAFLENHLHQQGGRTKLFYIGSMFRAERPQAGRFREFTQVGAECFGNPHPSADADAIHLLAHILDSFGLNGKYKVHVNNLGCEADACRPAFRRRLKAFLESLRSELCENCQKRINRNPLRALDCKKDGPRLKDRAPRLEPCGDCVGHFNALTERLLICKAFEAGQKPLEFSVDPALVRGLDYYTRTVFEFKSDLLGSQDALAGGGRYDGLVKSMGGPDTPAVGWALGVERVLLASVAAGHQAPSALTQVYVACQAEPLAGSAQAALSALRVHGFRADGGLFGSSLKAQMREAERLGAGYVLILGEEEYREGRRIIVKDMSRKDSQQAMTLDRIPDFLKGQGICPS